MARKKQVRTFHPIAMAKSLEAQNEAIGLFLAKFDSLCAFSEKISVEMMRAKLAELRIEGEAARKLLWPEDEENGQ